MFPAILVMLWAYLEFARGYPVATLQEERKFARYAEDIYSRMPQTILSNGVGSTTIILDDDTNGANIIEVRPKYDTNNNNNNNESIRDEIDDSGRSNSRQLQGSPMSRSTSGRQSSLDYKIPSSLSENNRLSTLTSANKNIDKSESVSSTTTNRNETFQIIKIVRVSSTSIVKPKPVVILRPISTPSSSTTITTTTTTTTDNDDNNNHRNNNNSYNNIDENRYVATSSLSTDLYGGVIGKTTDSNRNLSSDSDYYDPDRRFSDNITAEMDFKRVAVTNEHEKTTNVAGNPESELMAGLTPAALLSNLVPIEITKDQTDTVTVSTIEPIITVRYSTKKNYSVIGEKPDSEDDDDDDDDYYSDRDSIRISTGEPSYNKRRADSVFKSTTATSETTVTDYSAEIEKISNKFTDDDRYYSDPTPVDGDYYFISSRERITDRIESSKTYTTQRLNVRGSSVNPAEIYGRPEQIHGEPEQIHGEPEQIHGEPEQIHGEPEQIHGEPEQIHGEPERIHGEPERIHGIPEQPAPDKFRESAVNDEQSSESLFRVTSNEQRSTDENRFNDDYEKKRFLHNENYHIVEQQSIDNLDDTTTIMNRQTFTTEFFTTPTSSSNSDNDSDISSDSSDSSGAMIGPRKEQKSSYVVDSGNYRKYRVEERTPDGFIVGEYGIVSRHDGSLRGVRYTADSNINPAIIYETLVKFFALK